MHGFSGAPWNAHFFCDLGPHILFFLNIMYLPVPSLIGVDWSYHGCQTVQSRKRSFVFIPFIQPCHLALQFLAPIAPSFHIILIMKPATDGASIRQLVENILLFDIPSTKFDDEGVFLRRPFSLLLGRSMGRVRRHAALPCSVPWMCGIWRGACRCCALTTMVCNGASSSIFDEGFVSQVTKLLSGCITRSQQYIILQTPERVLVY